MSDLDGRQRAIARVCLGEAPPADALALLGGDPRRWQVYRDLVCTRLWRALLEALPRTYVAAGGERFGGWFTRFLDEAPPRTRFVREVAPAFGAWVRAAEGEALSRPAPWLPEALALDLAEHHVALSDARLDPSEMAAFSMDLPAALDPAHRRVRGRWAVEGEAVVERPRTLLLHRHPTLGSVETLELSALGADLLDAMDDGATPVTAAIGGVLSRSGLSADGAFAEAFAGLLSDLMEREVLLGSFAPI